MLMASLVLLAAPLSLFLRGDVRWRRTLPAVAVSSGAVVLIGQLLGYWGAGSDGGFGYYSMNLAAPFWPTFSALIPGIPYAPADGTGGQAEGYQYLGLGLLGLLAVSALGWARWWAHIRRHPGLALACIGLCALAVTNWVFLLHIRLVHIPLPSAVFSQMRASGRLFWPVAYALLITSALVTLRVFPRAGSLVVLAAALVQFADAAQLRRLDHDSLSEPAAYPFDQRRLSAILRAHDRLTVIPELPCNGGGTEPALDLLWLAGRTRMLINTMYMAREAHAEVCLPPEAIATRPAADEIRVILPGFDQALAALPDSAADCRVFQPYVLCTRHADLLAGLPAAVVRSVPMSSTLPIRAGAPGADTLMAGWTAPGAVAGAWSNAPSAFLGAPLMPAPPGAVRLRIRALAMPFPTGLGRAAPHRPVTVWVGTRRIAEWSVGPALSDFEAVVPADWVRRHDAVMVELRTSRMTSALDQGRLTDPRRFGILVQSIRFSPAD